MFRAAKWILILALLLAASQAFAGAAITRISDGQNVSLAQLLADAESSDLVLIGESHDNMTHHQMQLAVIRSLWKKQVPLAIGLEMMQSDSQQQLDEWTDGRLDEESFRAVFATNWSLDWQMYRDIFIFARDNRIPMVALNVPVHIVKKVARYGFGSLSFEEKRGLPQGTSCDLDNPHTAFLRKTFKEVFTHTANNKVFTYFCEAQTLRNSGMALNIARYHKKHPGRKVVALTGIWHAVKNAIPEQLERNGDKLACTVVLPEIPELGVNAVEASDADYLIGL